MICQWPKDARIEQPTPQNIIGVGQFAIVHKLNNKIVRKVPSDKSRMVLWRMVLWRMVLWRMALWKRALQERMRLSTSRYLQSLQAQRSALNGEGTGLQVAISSSFLAIQVIGIWKKIQQTCDIRRTKPSSRSNSVLPSKRSTRKRGKVRRRKTTTTTRKIRSRKLRTRWKNWQSQCRSSGH
jgi:hypothetical protein